MNGGSGYGKRAGFCLWWMRKRASILWMDDDGDLWIGLLEGVLMWIWGWVFWGLLG